MVLPSRLPWIRSRPWRGRVRRRQLNRECPKGVACAPPRPPSPHSPLHTPTCPPLRPGHPPGGPFAFLLLPQFRFPSCCSISVPSRGQRNTLCFKQQTREGLFLSGSRWKTQINVHTSRRVVQTGTFIYNGVGGGLCNVCIEGTCR